MATVTRTTEQRFHLSGVSWQSYVQLTDALGDRPLRATYDRGELELMSVSSEHERYKSLLRRLVEAMTEMMEIDIASYGSMTCRCEEMLRAFEPDECYWIQNETLVRGRLHIDLDSDPPPDLAFEIEISRSILDRLAICAALRIPEVWCWNGEKVRVRLLDENGDYQESERSRAFPFLPLNEIARFLTNSELSETQLIRAFRKWVREQIERDWNGE